MSLKRYRAKRDFGKTPEPIGGSRKKRDEFIFVVQKHYARRFHYDLRLEFGGALKSWSIPKGPSINPNDKRLAFEMEDHPVDYASFEGEIPAGAYGAGQVIIWDRGIWKPRGDVSQSLKKGRLDFELFGKKINGHWSLIRAPGLGGTYNSWLLMKRPVGRQPYLSDHSPL